MTLQEVQSLIEIMNSTDPVNKLLALELIKGLDKDGWILFIKTVIEPSALIARTLQRECSITKLLTFGQGEKLMLRIDRMYDPVSVSVRVNLTNRNRRLGWNIVILTLRLEFSDVGNIINLIDIDDESYQQFSKEINLIC